MTLDCSRGLRAFNTEGTEKTEDEHQLFTSH
jgi:hypothetical protein